MEKALLDQSLEKESLEEGKVLNQEEIETELQNSFQEIEGLEDEDYEEFNPIKAYQEVIDYEENVQVLAPMILEASLSNIKQHNPDAIIVGAGPVGLWTAIQIKLLIPNYHILLLEKHETYMRSHVLRLKKDSLKEIASSLGDTSFRSIAETLIGRIKTNDLESRLLEEAKRLGISKESFEVTDISSLKKEFSNLKLIIGCDGSHSKVRKEAFENKISVKETIEYVAFVKYEAQGKVESLPLTKAYAGLKLIKHLVYEAVGKTVEDRTPITLQIKIDAETYKKMEGCKFKTPYDLTNHKHLFDEKLLETITVWLNMRGKFNGEKRVENSIKVTTVNLDVYRAESVAKVFAPASIPVFLCGDSASGVPFFRALNNGLLLGSFLAKTLQENEDSIEKAIVSYNNYFSSHINREINNAKRIAWTHRLAEKAVQLNSKVPWQFISLKKLKKELEQPIQGDAK